VLAGKERFRLIGSASGCLKKKKRIIRFPQADNLGQ